jgi:transcriptional regulator GlxA family with amidase domain
MADAADAQHAVTIIEAFLRSRRPPDDPSASQIEAIVSWMITAPAGTRVTDVARHHGLTTRALQRLFRHHLGVGPKWVLQRYRLHEAAERIAAGRHGEWAEVALELGYADQAHFIRDFSAVVGIPPQTYALRSAADSPQA